MNSEQLQHCVTLKNLSIGYSRPIVSGINLTIRNGDYWGIIGSNGAGKTTLFKTILGLIKPLEGEINLQLQGCEKIAYVPQQTTIKTHLPISVKELILMPKQSAMPLVPPPVDLLEKLNSFSGRLKIKHLLNKQVSQISGGEKQKSLICRALMMGSPILLLDEPTNGMDLASEKEILILIKRLNQEDGYTILFVTHFLANLLNEADHFAILANKKIVSVTREQIVDSNLLGELYQRPVTIDSSAGHYSIRVGAKTS